MYRWSETSLRRMTGVRPECVVVANCMLVDAHAAGCLDLTIPMYGGLRTQREQDELVRRGVSETRNSRHLTGRALDVVPWIDGGPSWDLEDPAVLETYEWIWERWDTIAARYGWRFKPRIEWDWPHHELVDD